MHCVVAVQKTGGRSLFHLYRTTWDSTKFGRLRVQLNADNLCRNKLPTHLAVLHVLRLTGRGKTCRVQNMQKNRQTCVEISHPPCVNLTKGLFAHNLVDLCKRRWEQRVPLSSTLCAWEGCCCQSRSLDFCLIRLAGTEWFVMQL